MAAYHSYAVASSQTLALNYVYTYNYTFSYVTVTGFRCYLENFVPEETNYYFKKKNVIGSDNRC